MTERASLKRVATQELERLRSAVASGGLRTPLDRDALVGFGIRHQLEAIAGALAGHRTAACLSVLDVALAEREDRRPSPQLVWTGPEGPSGTARDTAIVLRALFEEARERVVLAGYSFDHARDVLAPLHRSMTDHGVEALFFVDVAQVERGTSPEAHLARQLSGFMASNWPFVGPRPHIYYDRRALVPGPPWCSLHAKCVVVDGAKAFISSANFTQRGQERNIEAGVLIEDPTFATFLAGQWAGLIGAGVVAEYRPTA